jgi:mannose-6-phosphate isomerase
MLNYPLKFEPILKDTIWGGEKLARILGKQSNQSNIGESWEISDVKDNVSVVSNGDLKGKSLKELINTYKGDLVGNRVFKAFGDKFPLLIKYIDANKDLSIQLHPDNELAKARHDSFGKTEMWFVMQADKGSNLIVGFKEEVTKEKYLDYLNQKKLADLLNFDPVDYGDVYFIPTGRVHAIGSGVMLAEIQQTSDVTYRLYDYDRQDSEGNYRELHTEEALDALDYSSESNYKTDYQKSPEKSTTMVTCEYFETNILPLSKPMTVDHSERDSFYIYMCVQGERAVFEGEAFSEVLNYGETLLVPARLGKFVIKPEGSVELLEVSMP